MNAVDQKYVEKVLKSYEEKKTTKIDELRALDKKATLGPKSLLIHLVLSGP